MTLSYKNLDVLVIIDFELFMLYMQWRSQDFSLGAGGMYILISKSSVTAMSLKKIII